CAKPAWAATRNAEQTTNDRRGNRENIEKTPDLVFRVPSVSHGLDRGYDALRQQVWREAISDQRSANSEQRTAFSYQLTRLSAHACVGLGRAALKIEGLALQSDASCVGSGSERVS